MHDAYKHGLKIDMGETYPGLHELFALCYRTQWARDELTPPELFESPELARYGVKPLMTLDQARAGIVKVLQTVSTREQLPPDFKQRRANPLLYKLNVVRIAIAEMARAHTLQGGSEALPILDELTQTLQDNNDFRSVYATYLRDNDGIDLTGTPTFAGEIMTLVTNRIAQSGDPFFEAFEHPQLAFLNGWSSPAFQRSDYKLQRSYRNRVITTQASVTVNRPAADLHPIIDPRNWHGQLPTLWPSPTTFINAVPSDRDQSGTPTNDYTIGNDEAPFFEQAGYNFGVLPATDYRNVLFVKINDTPPARTVKYRQSNCLTSEFLGLSRQAGGIDVDRGTVSVVAATNSTALTPFCTLTASKSSRFDIPTDDLANRVFNDVAAVGLGLLIEMFVLYGAVA